MTRTKGVKGWVLKKGDSYYSDTNDSQWAGLSSAVVFPNTKEVAARLRIIGGPDGTSPQRIVITECDPNSPGDADERKMREWLAQEARIAAADERRYRKVMEKWEKHRETCRHRYYATERVEGLDSFGDTYIGESTRYWCKLQRLPCRWGGCPTLADTPKRRAK